MEDEDSQPVEQQPVPVLPAKPASEVSGADDGQLELMAACMRRLAGGGMLAADDLQEAYHMQSLGWQTVSHRIELRAPHGEALAPGEVVAAPSDVQQGGAQGNQRR